MYRKNVLAARVELLQVSEVAGDFETATPLTFNRYSAYLQLKYCVSMHYSIFRFKSVTKYFAQGILVT